MSRPGGPGREASLGEAVAQRQAGSAVGRAGAHPAPEDPLQSLMARVAGARTRPLLGRVLGVRGLMVRAWLPGARLGEACEISGDASRAGIPAEVIGFDEDTALLAPIGDLHGVRAGDCVMRDAQAFSVRVGDALLGQVIDAFGQRLDGGAAVPGGQRRAVNAEAPPAMSRQRIRAALPLGVRAIDGLLTVARGQRVGIFGEPGAGKSSLLASILAGTQADVIVLALIGERGREVREWLEDGVPERARARTVAVVATSDRPAMERVKAAETATCVAEYFRDQGRDVLLMMDSVTRYARARREIGLAAGEPPTRRGYPPSLFAALPRLFERAGPAAAGSITGLYAVLTESDGEVDPIAEEVTSIVDGHIVLDAKLARSNRFPAIDVLRSRSRLMDQVVDGAQAEAAAALRDAMSRYAEVELLRRLGEYTEGVDPLTDRAIARHDAIERFLRQGRHERAEYADTQARLRELAQ